MRKTTASSCKLKVARQNIAALGYEGEDPWSLFPPRQAAVPKAPGFSNNAQVHFANTGSLFTGSHVFQMSEVGKKGNIWQPHW